MEIRKLKKHEVNAALELNRYSFRDMSEKYLDGVRNELMYPEDVIGAFEGEVLKACVWLRPFSMRFEGEEVPMTGIANVASGPDSRGKGYTKQLMTEAARLIMESEAVFSVLSPFSYEFYRRFGWEWCFSNLKGDFPMDCFNAFRKEQGNFQMIKSASSREIKMLDQVYTRNNGHYNGIMIRSEKLWKVKMGFIGDMPETYTVAVMEEDRCCGYMIYQFLERKMVVREMVFDTVAVRKQLFKFITTHNMQVDRVEIMMPPDDPIRFLLDNPAHKVEVIPGMCVMTADIGKVIELMGSDIDDGVFVFRISDTSPIHGGEKYEVTLENGKSHAQVTDEAHDFECSIQTFSQLVFRAISFEQAVLIGSVQLVTNHKSDLFSRFFDGGTAYMNDYF